MRSNDTLRATGRRRLSRKVATVPVTQRPAPHLGLATVKEYIGDHVRFSRAPFSRVVLSTCFR